MPGLPGPQGFQATSTGANSVDTAAIQANAVTNAKLAQMASHTLKANVGAATADPSDATFSQIGQAMALWEPDTIISSQVTSGNSDFFSVSGLTLTLIANATDPFIYSIGNDVYKLTANVTLTVTNNAHNFIYLDNTGALSRAATPCTYAFTAPAGPASGDFWYDLGKRAMKTYNGSSWVASSKIAIGYVRADAAVINATYACEPIGFTPFDRRKISSGADGFLNVTAGTTTIDTTKNYTAVVVISTANINHTAASTVGKMVLKSQGVVALMGSSGIELNGLGRSGGAGATGTGSSVSIYGFGGGGGGGGGGTSGGGAGSPTGNPSYLAASVGTGVAGTPGGGAGGTGPTSVISSLAFQSPGLFGGGGGGGGGDGGSAGGNGGAGGGSVEIVCSCLAATSGSVLRANGANGVVGGGANRGGGGGGGGGIIQIFSRNYLMNGTATANGGTGGGSGGAGSGAGGNGGAGVVSQVKI